MTNPDPHTRRAEFNALAIAMRPELHRYASRLVGSRFDGEDVLQDVMERAVMALADLDPATPLRPWLFRITHNRAIDLLRSRTSFIAQAEELMHVPEEQADPLEQLAQAQASQAAIRRFTSLPVYQRSVVTLKDVLGFSLEEIAGLLSLSLPAVKSHLHRGRTALANTEVSFEMTPPSDATRRYAALFTQRDWAGLRDLLAENVRLVQHNKATLVGQEKVGNTFFGIYDRMDDWTRLVPATADGADVLAVFTHENADRPAYVMRVHWRGDRIAAIDDYRYVRYVIDGMAIQLA